MTDIAITLYLVFISAIFLGAIGQAIWLLIQLLKAALTAPKRLRERRERRQNRDTSTSASARLRRRNPIRFALWIFLAAACCVFGVGIFFSSQHGRNNHAGSPPTPPPKINDQAAFQAKIRDDRRKLFSGLLGYSKHISTTVGEPAIYEIDLKALGKKEVAARPSGETRQFQVGGVQGAVLTPVGHEVKVELLADTQARQVIAQPGDTINWQWSITAAEPGNYELMLNLTTYQGDTDRALTTLHPPIAVHVAVKNTWTHRVDSAGNALVTWGGVAVAFTALLAFRAPLTSLVRARISARQEQQRSQQRDGYL